MQKKFSGDVIIIGSSKPRIKNRNIDTHDNWQTPPQLYAKLNNEFNFDFDPCPINPRFNGLNCEWKSRNYINPPYSRKLKEAFIRKAFEESKKGKLCVMLLPVSTSTKIFHEVIYPNAEIRFLKGRVKFIGINTFGEKVSNKCGMFDNMIVIFPKRSAEFSLVKPLEQVKALRRRAPIQHVA